MIHPDFVYWHKVAVGLLHDVNIQLRELRKNHEFDVFFTDELIFVNFEMNHDEKPGDKKRYLNAVSSYIKKKRTHSKIFVYVVFDYDIYFVVDEQYNTCHYASNSSGINYFKADRETREMIIMEERLFNV